jgi:SAM-dependent methyltransferase
MTNSRYAAVFGRNAAVSVAELAAVGAAQGFNVSPLGEYAALLEGFDLQLADRLGAITKVVELSGAAASSEEAIKQLAGAVKKPATGKVIFGISSYGSKPATGLTNQMRNILDKRGIKNRFMAKRLGKSGRPSDGELSAVQVKHNKLITKGNDWCLFETTDGWVYGRTVWIYDFEGFGHRDYDKPRSDSKRGMLPPQLARTMVNLATGGDPAKSVYDPFCGVGNVLIESADLGHRTFGSDISEKATSDARKNLEWLKPNAKWDVSVIDATKDLLADHIDAIVTEGYLGTLIAANTKDSTIESTATEVESITLKFFEQARKILESGDRLVMTWPKWRLKHSDLALPLVDRVKALGYTVVRPVPEAFRLPELTKRHSIDVSRPTQRVVHELFIFERT